MKFFIIAAALGLVTPAFSNPTTYQLSYNATYDHAWTSLRDVTCSTGEHGLLTRGYKTFSDLPTYPHIGGAPQIMSKDSFYCGSCWEITYTHPNGASKCINFTAIDASHDWDFTTSLASMNYLTDSQGEEPKSLQVVAHTRPPSWCGLSE